jgi:hypothetical protein
MARRFDHPAAGVGTKDAQIGLDEIGHVEHSLVSRWAADG